jgi:hypothetical protein
MRLSSSSSSTTGFNQVTQEGKKDSNFGVFFIFLPLFLHLHANFYMGSVHVVL